MSHAGGRISIAERKSKSPTTSSNGINPIRLDTGFCFWDGPGACFATSNPAACDFASRRPFADSPIGIMVPSDKSVFRKAFTNAVRREGRALRVGAADGVDPSHRRLAEISVGQVWQP